MELPTNVSDDVRRLNPGVFGKLLVFPEGVEAIQVKPSKYNAVRTGHYASKKEARYADSLRLRQQAGDISFFLEQVPFRLPGDVIHRIDFVVFTGKAGIYEVDFQEVKGKDLYAGKIKRRQVEDIYGIHIEVI